LNDIGSGAAHAERLAEWLGTVAPERLPAATRAMCRRLVLDVLGLAIAARNEDYIEAVLATAESGPCTAIGHDGGFDLYGAALVNGTAAHGEDYDDTFEGGPVHSGAVIVPALLALSERRRLAGGALLAGIAVGVELLCRLSLVAPKAIHKAGFHPTAVIGAIAAAAAAGKALGLDRARLASAIGIAGSQASGIIEYLAEGTWTKRMHAGWAAQSGVRAALMAEAGFLGPRTVLEGSHGFFHAFAPSVKADFEPLFRDLGRRWLFEDIAFKPYACGTMVQPYIDCAVMLARQGVGAGEVASMLCEVGEGTVHRLWDPLALKQRPPTPYAAKFSSPFCIAIGLIKQKAGLTEFSETAIGDRETLGLAAKISYVVDPNNPYPRSFTGHIRATLIDGRVIEVRQPHMRGGANEPMPDQELERKFLDNALHGGWSRERAQAIAGGLDQLFDRDPAALIGRCRGCAVDRLGRLDILVNNAALRRETPLAELTLAEWHEVLSIVLDGAFLLAKAAMPHLKAAGGGSIVNIGGLSAHTGAALRAHVVTAKAGLIGLTRALAHELAPIGVTVNCVVPGTIDTVRNEQLPRKLAHQSARKPVIERNGKPEEIAALVRLLCGPGARYTTGQSLHVNGGALMP
jgi:2-methylcitrate dehydratase PrpD/enoyl-[acyl-carrier-protein] reductase (NADH)